MCTLFLTGDRGEELHQKLICPYFDYDRNNFNRFTYYFSLLCCIYPVYYYYYYWATDLLWTFLVLFFNNFPKTTNVNTCVSNEF